MNRIATFTVISVLGIFAPLAVTGCAADTANPGSDQQAQRESCGSDCGEGSTTNTCANEFSGRAVALWAYGRNGNLLNATLADTGTLPATGGDLVKYVATADLPALLHADVLRAETKGSASQSYSEAELARVVIGLQALSVDLVKASATAECAADGTPTAHGESYLANLKLATTGNVTVDGTPNQVIDVPGILRVVINEQIPTVEGNHAKMTVNALHVTLLDEQEIILSSAEADITCQCAQ